MEPFTIMNSTNAGKFSVIIPADWGPHLVSKVFSFDHRKSPPLASTLRIKVTFLYYFNSEVTNVTVLSVYMIPWP